MNKNHRVTDNLDFTRIIHKGSFIKTDALVLYYTRNSDQLKVGFAVSKKVGNAVVRNKVRRQLRSLFRTYINQYPHLEIIVVVRKAYLGYRYEDLKNMVAQMLNKTEINN